MKNNLSISQEIFAFEQLLDAVVVEKYPSNKQIVIFGATFVGQSLLQLLERKGILVSHFIDNSNDKIGTTIYGKKVNRPCPQTTQGYFIYITSAVAHDQMTSQLEGLGLIAGKNFCSIVDIHEKIGTDTIQQLEMLGQKINIFTDTFFFSTHFNPHRNCLLYTRIYRTVKKYTPLKQIAILDFGFGNSLVIALLFLLQGSDYVHAVEKQISKKVFNTYQYKQLIGYIFEHQKNIPGLSACSVENIFTRLNQIMHFQEECVNFTQEFLHTVEDDLANVSHYDRQFNLIYSTNVLEHISEPEKVIRSMSLLAKDGCLCWHSIDLSDHINPRGVPQFYTKEKQNLYNKNGINGLRANDWLSLIESNGWVILEYDVSLRCDISEVMKNKLHSNFKNYQIEDLQPLEIVICARYAENSLEVTKGV